MTASIRILDFTDQDDPEPPSFKHSGRTKSVDPKQIRARIRRRKKRGFRVDKDDVTWLQRQTHHKPIEEWDAEELAKGRPKSEDGKFHGRAPSWISRELYEEATDRFRRMVKDDLNVQANIAVITIKTLLESEECDEKGKPLVPASVKLDAAKWLVEHVVGKPKQVVEQDISVKLQGVLAQAMIVPGASLELPMALPGEAGFIDVEEVDDDDDD